MLFFKHDIITAMSYEELGRPIQYRVRFSQLKVP